MPFQTQVCQNFLIATLKSGVTFQIYISHPYKYYQKDIEKHYFNNRAETITGRTDNRFEILSKESEENTLQNLSITLNRDNNSTRSVTQTNDNQVAQLQLKLLESEKKINKLERRLAEKEKASNELIKETKELRKRNMKLKKDLAEKQLKENMNTNHTKPSDEKKHKPKVIIAGDSIVKDMKGWMSRNKLVKVHSFSGANTTDIESFLVPLLNKKPDHLILYAGTNDLAYSNANQVDERTVKLTGMVTSRRVNCSVSELTVRDDDLWAKVKEVNNLLGKKLPQNVKIISNSNITPNHLNRSRLHLNQRGTGALAFNFIQFMKSSDFLKKNV